MKKIINSVISLALVIVIAIMAVGCDSQTASPSTTSNTASPTTTKKPSGKEVTLTYASWADATLEQAMIEAFMVAHPNITVVRDTTIAGSGTAFTENLVTAAQGGILPDVFVTDNVPTVIKNGLVYDVSEYWDKDDDAKLVYENIASTAVYGSKRLAVPSYQFVRGIFVNITLLDKLGIDIPDYDWTWDDFYDICKKVHKAGTVNNKPVYAINGYYGALDFEKAMSPQDDLTIGYDTWNGEAFNYQNESWLKYRNLTQVFYDDGLLEQLTPAEKEEIYGDVAAYPFGQGQVAFGVEGSWNAQATVDNFKSNGIEAEFYPYPAGTNGQNEPVILDFMCVSSQTVFPEEAYELLKWMSYGKDGWAERLKIMKNTSDPLDRYPVAAYDEIWEELITYMKSLDYNGMTATIEIIEDGVPDCDKWLPGYSTFWNYINDSSEDMGWFDMSVDQMARQWTTLLNKYVDDAYEELGLER